MGTIRSIQYTEDEFGNKNPTVQGYSYKGVILGSPVELDNDPTTWEWDDSAFPNGSAEIVDGELIVTPDEEEL